MYPPPHINDMHVSSSSYDMHVSSFSYDMHAEQQEFSLAMAEEAEQKMLKELAQGRFTSSPGTNFKNYSIYRILQTANAQLGH